MLYGSNPFTQAILVRRVFFFILFSCALMSQAYADGGACERAFEHPKAQPLPEIGDLTKRPVPVLWRGQTLKLERLEAVTLKLLMSKPVATYADLAREVWGRESVTLDAIQSVIKGLRAKFRKIDPDFAAILSVPKVGFRWNFERTPLPQPKPKERPKSVRPTLRGSLNTIYLGLPGEVRDRNPFAPPEFLGIEGSRVQVKWLGEKLSLTHSEFLILQVLVERFPATSSEIAEHVWGTLDVSMARVVNLVAALRVKLRQVAPHHIAILRVSQTGYQWNWGIDPHVDLNFSLKPDFPSSLELDPLTYFVKWKGRVFQLFPAEFLALEALVWPEDSILLSKKDLIFAGYGPDTGRPADGTAFDLIKSLTDKFRAVDPEFDAIDRILFEQEFKYMWKEVPIQTFTAFGGRLKVGKSAPFVWLDEQVVKVHSSQYEFLRTLCQLGAVDLVTYPQYSNVVHYTELSLRKCSGGRPVLQRYDNVVRFVGTGDF